MAQNATIVLPVEASRGSGQIVVDLTKFISIFDISSKNLEEHQDRLCKSHLHTYGDVLSDFNHPEKSEINMSYRIASVFLFLTLISNTPAGQILTPHARHTQLGSINPHNGKGTNIGSFEQSAFLVAGAFDVDSQFYSVALLPGLTNSQLAHVDTVTGEATLIGDPTSELVVPLEVSDDGTMYTVGYHWPGVLGSSSNLFTVDKTDGQLEQVGEISTGVTRAMDLAFDSEGTLWLVSGGADGNHLYTLDLDSGEANYQSTITGVEEATEPGAEVMGIMFDEYDTLFATAYFAPNADFVSPLFSVDTVSGEATVIGSTGLVNPHGGDYSSLPAGILGNPGLDGVIPPGLRSRLPVTASVPEPTSAMPAMLGCCCCLLLRRRWRA